MRKIAAALALVTTTLAAPAAFAAPPAVVSPGWNGEALLGFGFHDFVGFGLGVRAGYTLPDPNIYIGGALTYHFGNNNANTYYFAAEGGYDLAAGPVIVRPYLGIGPAWFHSSGFTSGPFTVDGNTVTRFAVYPGCTVAYPLDDRFFVGGDARILFVEDLTSFNLFAMGGMNF